MPETYNFDPFQLDAREHLLLRDGRPVSLPPKAFDLLLDLVEHAGHLREKKQLMDVLWPGTFVEEVNLAYTVSALRKALGDGREDHKYIETVPTKGYRFVGAMNGRDHAGSCGPATALAGASEAPVLAIAPVAPHPGRRTSRLTLTAVVVAVLLALVTGVLLGRGDWFARRSVPEEPLLRLQLGVEPAEELNAGGLRTPILTAGGSRTALAWTPDGRRLVFVGRRDGAQHLYVRSLDQSEARRVPGTEEAQVPCVSPDGRWIVFWAHGEIKRVPLEGGPVERLVEDVAVPPLGLDVGVTGRIVFARDDGHIWLLNGESPPTTITSPGPGENLHLLPRLLSNDTVVLFTARGQVFTSVGDRVVAQVIATGQRTVLIDDAADARRVAPGRLVFLRRSELMTVPFDEGRLVTTGEPVAVVDGVSQALTCMNAFNCTRAGQYAVAPTGTLAYVASPIVPPQSGLVVTVDQRGRTRPFLQEPGPYLPMVRLSPDGTRVALVVMNTTEHGLWVADLARGGRTKLAGGGEAFAPRWTPDGARIAVHWAIRGLGHLDWLPVDGSGPPERLADVDALASSWSPDGRHLAVVAGVGDHWGMFVVAFDGSKRSILEFPETEESQRSPEFSPDGRWLAYVSNKSGRDEVYTRLYPVRGAVIPVSIAGGGDPAWNPRGDELFFVEPVPDAGARYRMMSVPVRDGHPGRAHPLFVFENSDLFAHCLNLRCYDVTRDGREFLMVKMVPRDPPAPVTHINVDFNWIETLKANVQGPAAR